jgi:hypothetical protein
VQTLEEKERLIKLLMEFRKCRHGSKDKSIQLGDSHTTEYVFKIEMPKIPNALNLDEEPKNVKNLIIDDNGGLADK